MRFQRYPDGSMHWTWFIWSRHPRWSQTWTHSLSLSMLRRSSGARLRPTFFRFGSPTARGQWGWTLNVAGLTLRMMRQSASGPNDPLKVVNRLARSIADVGREEPK